MDEHLNRWHVGRYTEELALKRSFELVNCEDCVECTKCSNCRYCRNCADCVECTYSFDLNDCKSCTFCYSCKRCDGCHECDTCINCSYLRFCEHCDTCCALAFSGKCSEVMPVVPGGKSPAFHYAIKYAEALHSIDSGIQFEMKTRSFRFTLSENGKCNFYVDDGSSVGFQSSVAMCHTGNKGISSLLENNDCGTLSVRILCFIDAVIRSLNKFKDKKTSKWPLIK